MWVGGLPVYHLAVEADEMENPQAYGAASARDQAGIVFEAAAGFVKSNPRLSERLKIIPSTKRIVRKDGHGRYQVLSADGDVQDGIEPSLFVRDELHRWRTARAKTLGEVLIGGTIARPESLGVDITTAGDVYDSPLCWIQHQRARQILEGSLKSDNFHGRIFGLDEAKLKADPDYWKTREARVEANPSHEDRGGFLEDAKILEKLEELGEPAYKRYHLNIWGQKAERWMDMPAWVACGQETRSLIDRECWIGLDLSKTTDFTGLMCIFPDADGTLDLLPFAWVPRERVRKITVKTHQDIQKWVAEGQLLACDGEEISYAQIRAKIDELSKIFRIREICYDPWNATQFTQELVDAGYRCIEIRQGPPSLSAPMKYLLGKVVSGKVRHGNHEVLNWHMDCVVARSDANGNIAPDKSHLERDGKRIDLVSALVTGLARYLRLEQSKQSAYGSLPASQIAV